MITILLTFKLGFYLKNLTMLTYSPRQLNLVNFFLSLPNVYKTRRLNLKISNKCYLSTQTKVTPG